ncbi:hypothetical protein MKW98_023149 [Papaver atlanticum]|uniref:Uncharacterized protein n=1 Tax=Papaver atlanticum TaxID=357466 RepID=A0AAD4TAL1_9MAGN|nr:hypothetical protein MKW98_023149 [Papaver atlanticum]
MPAGTESSSDSWSQTHSKKISNWNCLLRKIDPFQLWPWLFKVGTQQASRWSVKGAGILKKLAPTIGIAVDHRHRNKSLEGLQTIF